MKITGYLPVVISSDNRYYYYSKKRNIIVDSIEKIYLGDLYTDEKLAKSFDLSKFIFEGDIKEIAKISLDIDI